MNAVERQAMYAEFFPALCNLEPIPPPEYVTERCIESVEAEGEQHDESNKGE